jgi:hypothetical protein
VNLEALSKQVPLEFPSQYSESGFLRFPMRDFAIADIDVSICSTGSKTLPPASTASASPHCYALNVLYVGFSAPALFGSHPKPRQGRHIRLAQQLDPQSSGRQELSQP